MGQGTGPSLNIQPGARQNGFGSAGVALVSDPSDAMWWNPAALGFTDRISGQFTRAQLVPGLANDVFYYHAAAAAPLGSFGGFGTSFTHLDYGEGFGSESSPSIGLGLRVHSWLSLGATLKWIEIGYGPGGTLNGETFAADVGALARVERGPWKLGFGFMYQNFGGRARFDDGSSRPLHRNYKVGASAEVPIVLTSGVTIGGVAVVDFNQSDLTSDFRTWNGGLEGFVVYADLLRIAGRVGYYYDDLGEIQDLTSGVGVRLWILAVDGAWIPQARDSDLDRVFKLTVGVHTDLSLPGRTRAR